MSRPVGDRGWHECHRLCDGDVLVRHRRYSFQFKLFITARVLTKVAYRSMSFTTAFTRTQPTNKQTKQPQNPKDVPPRPCRFTQGEMQIAMGKLDLLFTDQLLYKMLTSEINDRTVPGKTVAELWAILRENRIGRSELRAFFNLDGMKFVEENSRPSQRRKEKASWEVKASTSTLPDWMKVAEERKIVLSDKSKRNLALGSNRLASALFSKLKIVAIPAGTSPTTLSKYQRYLKALEYDIPLSRSKWAVGHVQSLFNTRKNAFRLLKCRSSYLGFVGAFGHEEWVPSESSFEEPEGHVATNVPSDPTVPPSPSAEKLQGGRLGAQEPSDSLMLQMTLESIMDRLDMIEQRLDVAPFSEPVDNSATDPDDVS